MKLEMPQNPADNQSMSKATPPLPNQNWLCEASPLGLYAGDTNLYRFVGDDPVNEVDPSGLAKIAHADQEFWKTDYGKQFWADIEKAAEYLKTSAKMLIDAVNKLDPKLKAKYKKEIASFIDRMNYIIDKVDHLKISARFDFTDIQASPGRGAIGFHVFSMYSLMDKKGEKPYSRPDKCDAILTLPLPGHMGMSDELIKSIDPDILTRMRRNEDTRIRGGLPEPKTVRWDSRQIASLLANELMHMFESDNKGSYEAEGSMKKMPKVNWITVSLYATSI